MSNLKKLKKPFDNNFDLMLKLYVDLDTEISKTKLNIYITSRVNHKIKLSNWLFNYNNLGYATLETI